MNTATVYFSDKSTLTLSENSILIPIIQNPHSDDNAACMGEPVQLIPHIHEGLIPPIMDALCFCQFFYVDSSDSPAYCTSSIIKIEHN